jgi:predicted Zn-dependent protease
MQFHSTDKALSLIQVLIDASPDDPFYYELKGDILRNAGRMEEAVIPYEKAIKILPWASLIRTAVAHVMVEIENPDLYAKALVHLNNALRYEPWSSRAWRLKATIYGRQGKTGKVALSLAEEDLWQKNMLKAKGLSKKAMTILPQGSAGWLRAQDISIQAKL